MVAILGFVDWASVVCHLLSLLVGCCDVMRRHCEDREYCRRAASWQLRVIERAGAVIDMMVTAGVKDIRERGHGVMVTTCAGIVDELSISC